MGWLALVLACSAAVSAILPSPGMFVGMGLGIFAVAAGLVGYRRRMDTSAARLAGAGAITVGLVALLVSLARYALTLAALSKLERLL